MARKKTDSFEKLLEETEGIVDRLESGEMDLDESLKQYEKGVANLRRCSELIALAEKKVKMIIEKSGGEFGFENLDEDDVEKEREDDEE